MRTVCKACPLKGYECMQYSMTLMKECKLCTGTVLQNRFKGENLTFFDVCIYETDLCIGACSNLHEQALKIVAILQRAIGSLYKSVS